MKIGNVTMILLIIILFMAMIGSIVGLFIKCNSTEIYSVTYEGIEIFESNLELIDYDCTIVRTHANVIKEKRMTCFQDNKIITSINFRIKVLSNTIFPYGEKVSNGKWLPMFFTIVIVIIWILSSAFIIAKWYDDRK